MRLARRLDPMAPARSRGDRRCPICGFEGPFRPAGLSPRPDALCPGCGSLERHRLLRLAAERSGVFATPGRVLHFAPEAAVTRFIRPLAADYVTSDPIMPDVDLRLDVSDMALEDESVDAVICIHVLEHVPRDRDALAELRRILRPGGAVLLDVPMIHAMAETYEDPSITDPAARLLHFGQPDHVRQYGRDFPDRAAAAGLEVTPFETSPREAVAHALPFGVGLHVARRPAA